MHSGNVFDFLVCWVKSMKEYLLFESFSSRSSAVIGGENKDVAVFESSMIGVKGIRTY